MKKLFLILLAPIFLVACSKTISQGAIDQSKTTVDSPIVVEQSFKDLGTIAMDKGEVSAIFKLKNIGSQPVVIKEMETSCMCTSAVLKVGDEDSYKVGMRGIHDIYMIIQPNQEATVEGIFDPNFHGPNGVGLNRRSIFLDTNSSISPKIKLDFQANVVKTSDEIHSKESISFQEKDFDFGFIKQSGGIVKHDFLMTYNGENDIKILGLPTSCGCTSAQIDKDSLSKGEQAIVTVSFDPNLHAEPSGKFFKSINIITDPKLEEDPEIQIRAEIDLDLGEQAYKLRSEHDEEGEVEEVNYNSITSNKFSDMLKNKDFILLDVHIPEQEHIASTDLFIPYDSIGKNVSKLPEDKNSKIVVYCRSGSMSRAAADSLVELGYDNVYDLVGGKQAYDMFLEGES